MNDLYLGAYWGPREENIDQCITRLFACLNRLQACAPAFTHWYKLGRSRKDALSQPFDFQSRNAVCEMLESGRHLRDLDRSRIDDLGFRVALWNGETGPQSASLNIGCGLYSSNPHLRNSVVVNPPENHGVTPDRDFYARVLRIVADVWEPDWAGVISRRSRDARPFNPAFPFVDWMFYINRVGIDRAKMPASATASEVDGKGTIVVVQDKPIDPSSEVDLRNTEAVAAMFGVLS